MVLFTFHARCVILLIIHAEGDTKQMQFSAEDFEKSMSFGFYFDTREAAKRALLFLFDELREYLKEWIVRTVDEQTGAVHDGIFTVHLAQAAELLLKNPTARAYGSYLAAVGEVPLCLYAQAYDEKAGAVLLQLPRAFVLKPNTDFSVLSAILLNAMEDVQAFMPYRYAFCDTQGAVQCTPQMLQDDATLCPYSLLLFVGEAETEVRLGATELDENPREF